MPKVCIIGAGYAGIHAARTASDAGAEVVLVDPTGQHDLTPRLAAVAAGRRPAGDAWAPIEDLVDVELVRDRVVRVDTDGPGVELADGGPLGADAVVVTVGAPPYLPDVPGLDHRTAWTLQTAPDALRLRAALDTSDALVVVGGGATGVQLAAETAAQHPEREIHLIELTDRLLGAFPHSLGRRAATVLRRRGVQVELSTDVTAVDAQGVVLGDGRRRDGLVVWATGISPDARALLPGAATTEGRLLVDRKLRVAPQVLAAGDVAAHRDVFGRVTAPSAQIALQAGRAAGRNAAAIARGDRPRSVPLVDLGWVVDLGGRGVARVGPVDVALPIADRVVPLLHELVDLRHLLQAGGPSAVVAHAPGRHRPTDAELRRAERPSLRSVV